MSNTRISVPFIKNKTIRVSKLCQVSLQLVGFTIFLRSKIGWVGGGGGGGGGRWKETRQCEYKRRLISLWMRFFAEWGLVLHLNRGSFSILSYTEVMLAGGLHSSVHREVTKADRDLNGKGVF